MDFKARRTHFSLQTRNQIHRRGLCSEKWGLCCGLLGSSPYWLFQTNNLLLSLIYFYRSSTAKDTRPGSLIPFRAQRLLESSSLLNGDPQILPDPEPRSCPCPCPAQSSSPQILTDPRARNGGEDRRVCVCYVCAAVSAQEGGHEGGRLTLHANLALPLVFLLRVLSLS